MNDLERFKSIKKFSKLSIIFSVLIFVGIILFAGIIPAIIVTNSNGYYQESNIDSLVFISGIISIFGTLLCVVFGILILIFNIIIIIKASSLEQSKDKNLLIIMSILSFFLLGIIFNIVTLIVSNKNIKILSNGSNNTTVNEPTKPTGPDIY